ncbi:2Fe-2S iron-sulfur cluster-binding protein [Burkholderia sp. lig30]|jgi:2Fe-2S ferredoxin|uniref:2Fe-2S iron-sulfur cluster-binding protein n=1 Tax=Burkholderia sp. lig30 TaxID=1192124 RepID=UPI0005721AA4|nr:2Fe-2S iron-sulfur cluster-binding protein [Burkholderia sp. lig30]
MAKITYIEHGGAEHVVDVPEGYSLMEGATKNSVPGIVAECMGGCACATCHIYVDPAWRGAVPNANDDEIAMLEYASDVQEGSRLSCQIKVTRSMDGMVVRMPASQG